MVFCAERLSGQALRAAIREAPDGIGMCDEDGRMVAVSGSPLDLVRRIQDESCYDVVVLDRDLPGMSTDDNELLERVLAN